MIPPPSEPTGNEKVARAYFNCYNSKNVEEQLSYFAEDVTFTDPVIRVLNPKTSSITVKGREGLRGFFRDVQSKIKGFAVLDPTFIITGDRGAIEFKVESTGPDGKSKRIAVTEVLTFKAGKIGRVRSYFDTVDLTNPNPE